MTTEKCFQDMLDANREDWQTRLVFSEWLRDRDDPRADGYQALGVRKRVPVPKGDFNYDGFCTATLISYYPPESPSRAAIGWAVLPMVWLEEMEDEHNIYSIADYYWYCRKSRREVEDAAALAFIRLPDEVRAALLTPAEAVA